MLSRPQQALSALLHHRVPMRGFASSGSLPERFFLVEYSFIEDAYYKRIPVREEHLAALEKLKTSA